MPADATTTGWALTATDPTTTGARAVTEAWCLKDPEGRLRVDWLWPIESQEWTLAEAMLGFRAVRVRVEELECAIETIEAEEGTR